MPEWLAAIVFGLIEGITEFLPISSTGHLLIAQQWLGQPESELFTTVIQCGTVLAVLAVFFGRMKELFAQRGQPEAQRYVGQLFLAFFVTAAGGLMLKMLGHFQLEKRPGPVAWAILIGGILMLVIERLLKGRELSSTLTWTAAVAIGLSQLAAAVFPGTSRSGATILMALAFGLRRPLATEFSFLLGVPTLLAAGVLEVYSAHKHGTLMKENWGMVGLASLVATVTAFISVRWLLRYVRSHTFDAFGWYRVAFGLLLIVYFWS